VVLQSTVAAAAAKVEDGTGYVVRRSDVALALEPLVRRALSFLSLHCPGFAGNAILVPILTWIVMPALTRLLAGWLFTKPAPLSC